MNRFTTQPRCLAEQRPTRRLPLRLRMHDDVAARMREYACAKHNVQLVQPTIVQRYARKKEAPGAATPSASASHANVQHKGSL